MRYWLLTTEFPPTHGGGISTYCLHTAKMLACNNHEVTVFVNDYSVEKEKREKLQNNISIIRFNPNQAEIGKALGPEVRLSLEFANIVEKEILNSGKPDILETQDYLGIGYYTLQKKLLQYPNFKNLKIVLTIHAPSFLYLEYNQVPHYNFPEYWIGEMEKACIKMADLVITPSNYIVDELKSRMQLKEVNPMRVFNPYKNDWSLEKTTSYQKNDIVFLGKLTPQKGCIEMMQYFKKMWDNGFKTPITIIGGGEHFFYPMQEDMIVYFRKKYDQEIKSGLILFEGNMLPEKLKTRLAKAHVIVIPSIVDNLPYAVLETMAMGKIVLASKNSGHIEVINHKKNGFLFDHSNKSSFEKELTSILNLNKLEVDFIVDQAQKDVEELTNYGTVYSQKKTLLDNLLQKPSSRNYPFIEVIEKKQHTKSFSNQTEKSKLSIVVPYFNMDEYVEDTIQSLVAITYSDYEIIIINDGSTKNNSLEKLNYLEEKYQVKVYHKSNEGLSATRNFGAEKANGEFLAFLDSDDTVSPNYYEKAITVLKEYDNVSFVGCWAQYFGESTDIWPSFNPEPPYLLTHNMINSSALVYKHSDFVNFGLNDSKMIYGMEDYDSVISMVKNGCRGVALPEALWQYRIRKNSMAQSFNRNKELYLYRLIGKKHAQFFNDYGSEIAAILNHNDSGISFDNPTWPKAEFDKRLLNTKAIQLIKKNRILRGLGKKVYRLLNK
ncbi:MAG: glycosyltransferase involved in cell wall biosynthesis [Vicingaceae bacterium]|jgi:glycosyltransferase involved in cell wall biosynthesis